MIGLATLPGMRSAMPRLLFVAGTLAFSVCATSVSHAQVAAPAHISVTEGSVAVDRESGSETGLPDLPLVEGDRVRTEQGRAEILLDGGVRTGQDVLKALALGAKGCLMGKAFLYALAAMGEAGVALALDIIRKELGVSLALTGANDVRNVTRDILVRP